MASNITFPLQIGDKIYSPVRESFFLISHVPGRTFLINMGSGRIYSSVMASSSQLNEQQGSRLLGDIAHDGITVTIAFDKAQFSGA